MFRLRSNRQTNLIGLELQEKINQLHHAYMPMDLNTAHRRSKLIAMDKLNFILKHTHKTDLQDSDFQEVLLCALTVLYYFGMRLKLCRISSPHWHWCARRQFKKAQRVLERTIDQLSPERSDTAIKIILDFFTNVNLWPFESFAVQILEMVLYFNRGRTSLFHIMLTDIHCVLFHDVASARHRMKILYDLLKSKNWAVNEQKLLSLVTRLLDFFAYSMCRSNSKVPAYGHLRKGFDVCLRSIFERVENHALFAIISTMLNWFSVTSTMSDEEILQFSALLDHAAKLYKVEIYSESITKEVFDHVLIDLVGSLNASYSLVGCRLLQRFLDRQNNSTYLSAPTIYYEFSQIRLKVGICNTNDKEFIEQYREKLHQLLMKAIKLHGANSTNLKSVYAVICCIILEVPCSMTATVASYMAMCIQDHAKNEDSLPASCRYWMHAMVISVMSLICWVHRAPVLYRYVNEIIARRAKDAPQLNPPLMRYYDLERRHVTWNKPTLFFEDWELRYGLWKHFQDVDEPSRLRRHSACKKDANTPITKKNA